MSTESTMPDFPVVWENPAEADQSWFFDMVHFPYPVTPLDFSILVKSMETGINRAAQTYEMGFQDTFRHINSYVYDSAVVEMGTPDAMAAQARRSQQKLDAAVVDLGRRWQDEWLPEIKDHMAYWEGYNSGQASASSLLEHLDETVKRHQRLWEIHFLLFYPMMIALSGFEEMYRDLFSDAGQFDAYELLGGFKNKTVESNQALWQLSRRALASPIVRQTLAENAAEAAPARLAESAEGQAFLAELNRYLQEYGRRGDRLSLAVASWLEEPMPAIKNLQDYIIHSDRDSATEMEEAIARREQRIAQAREALEAYPQPVVAQFESLLKAAQVGYRLSEDHNFWIDSMGTHYVRQVCLEFGRRLAEAGVIDARDDIFYLTVEELSAVSGISSSPAFQTKVDERRATEAKFGARTPPPFLGAPPPEEMADDPFYRMIEKFFGGAPPETEAENALRGFAGSPGKATGTARVILTLDELDRLNQGDILVAKTTTTLWTSSFSTIAAIVTDSGGILSHSAIVAREYGIPAVVGANGATAMIKDGQTIEVNGDVGLVQILSD